MRRESWPSSTNADAGNVNADDLQTVVIPGVGHWLAEQAPEEMLAALNSFLSPYRDGHPALRTSSVTGALDR